MQKIKLGKITAPVGIRGEIRVYPYLDQTRFSDIRKVSIAGAQAVNIEKMRFDKNMVVMKLEGINDRNAAESLREKELLLPEGETIDLGQDNYLIEDLIGMKVVDASGVETGTLINVVSRTMQDLYEIEMPGGRTFLLPAVKEFILDVDTAGRVMKVKLPEGITEL